MFSIGFSSREINKFYGVKNDEHVLVRLQNGDHLWKLGIIKVQEVWFKNYEGCYTLLGNN